MHDCERAAGRRSRVNHHNIYCARRTTHHTTDNTQATTSVAGCSWQWIASSLPADAVLSELEATASEAARAVPDPHLAAESPSLCRRTDPSAHQCPMRRVLAPFTYVSLHASCACWHWTRGRVVVPAQVGDHSLYHYRQVLLRLAPRCGERLASELCWLARLMRSYPGALATIPQHAAHTCVRHCIARPHSLQQTIRADRLNARITAAALTCAETMADGLASAGFCVGVGATAQPLRRSLCILCCTPAACCGLPQLTKRCGPTAASSCLSRCERARMRAPPCC